jgi:MFS family permease
VLTAAVQTASLLGLVVAGPLVDHFDPRPLVAAAGGLGLLISLAAVLLVRREAAAAVPSVPQVPVPQVPVPQVPVSSVRG